MMRIVWGLRDTHTDTLMVLFEAENLLVGYREQLLRPWYDALTAPVPVRDYLPGDDPLRNMDDTDRAERDSLLDIGFDRWRIDEINSPTTRFRTEKYELWDSTPPNVELLVWHFN